MVVAAAATAILCNLVKCQWAAAAVAATATIVSTQPTGYVGYKWTKCMNMFSSQYYDTTKPHTCFTHIISLALHKPAFFKKNATKVMTKAK